MDELFAQDLQCSGAKAIVFIGGRLLVYRRDTNTKRFPLCLDLPGGGHEVGETPFETIKREIREEFGLAINRKQVVWAKRYVALDDQRKHAYYAVLLLPASAAASIELGNEGTEWLLLKPGDFLSRKDAWPAMQDRVRDFMKAGIPLPR